MNTTPPFCSQETNAVTAATEPAFRLTPETVAELRRVLPGLAERTVAAIIDAVPSYSDALSGAMGETIRLAVETALGGFVQLASRSSGETPPAEAVDGAYQLGRGEARGGRTVDALLSAYRIGARVSWSELSAAAVRTGRRRRDPGPLRHPGLRLHRAAVRGQPGRSHRRAGEHRAGPPAPARAPGGPAARRVAARGGGRGGRARRVAAAEDPDRGRRTGLPGAARAGQPVGGDPPGRRGATARGR